MIGSWEVNTLVIRTRSLYVTLSVGFQLMSLKSEGGGQSSSGSISESLEEPLSVSVSDAESQSLAKRQSAEEAGAARSQG